MRLHPFVVATLLTAVLAGPTASGSDDAEAGIVTTAHEQDFVGPSLGVASAGLLSSPGVEVRPARPAHLEAVLVEVTWQGPTRGTSLDGLRVLVTNDESHILGEGRSSDEQGIIRVELSAQDWLSGALSISAIARGEPVSIQWGSFTVYTTTFVATAMPPGFTAVAQSIVAP